MEDYPSPAEGNGLENRQACKSAQGFESLILLRVASGHCHGCWRFSDITDMIHLSGKLTVFPYYRGVEQLAARRAHNPEVTGSSPVPAIVMIVAASAAYKHDTLGRKPTVFPVLYSMGNR